MPMLDGIAATRAITALPDLAGMRVAVLTTCEDDRNVLLALRAGASGFVGKVAEPAELLDAVRVVAPGARCCPRGRPAHWWGTTCSAPTGPNSTPTTTPAQRPQRRAADRPGAAAGHLGGAGITNTKIATELVLSRMTVKTHVNRARAKVGARDRAQLVVLAYRSGLVTLPRSRRLSAPS